MWDGGLDPSREGFSLLPIPRLPCCGYVSYGVNIFGTHPRSLTCMFRNRVPITCAMLFLNILVLFLFPGIFPDSPDALDVPLDLRLKNNSFDVSVYVA